jgi:hypothetical protein
MLIKLNLTPEQLTILEPLFKQVTAANKNGSIGAIGAQIYRDGMVVKFFDEEKAEALCSALGGNVGDYHQSADARIEAANHG